jgi:hypothetical protein
MRDWALELHQHELRLPGYHVHVVDWVPNALGIEDEVSGDCFSSYHQRLFDSGTPLAEWPAADR